MLIRGTVKTAIYGGNERGRRFDRGDSGTKKKEGQQRLPGALGWR